MYCNAVCVSIFCHVCMYHVLYVYLVGLNPVWPSHLSPNETLKGVNDPGRARHVLCAYSINGREPGTVDLEEQTGQESDKVGVWNIWDIAPQPEVKLTALTSIEKPE